MESINLLREEMVKLAETKENLKAQLKEIDSKLEETLLKLGEGEVFQASNGLVYKVTKPTGTFISFKTIDYTRTRKEGEKGGSYLAKKEAEVLGFKLA